jgi:hypothetical protein
VRAKERWLHFEDYRQKRRRRKKEKEVEKGGKNDQEVAIKLLLTHYTEELL